MTAHTVTDHAALFACACDHLAAGTHTKGIYRPLPSSQGIGVLAVTEKPSQLFGLLRFSQHFPTEESFFHHPSLVLNSEPYAQRLFRNFKSLVFKITVNVAGAVSRSKNDRAAFDLARVRSHRDYLTASVRYHVL